MQDMLPQLLFIRSIILTFLFCKACLISGFNILRGPTATDLRNRDTRVPLKC